MNRSRATPVHSKENIPERDTAVLELAASTILRAAAPGKIKLPCAMRLAGFTDEECKVNKLQMRVRRLLLRECPPKNIKCNSSRTASTITAVSTVSTPPHLIKKTCPKTQRTTTKKQLSLESLSRTSKPPPEIESSKRKLEQLEGEFTKPKSTRLTSNQKRAKDARMIMQKEHDKKGHKVATALVFENREKPIESRQSDASIIRQVNLQHGCNLSVHTIQRSVKKGLIGESPLRRGPVGHFPKPVWDGLRGAFATYLKLKQAGGKTELTNQMMEPHVFACLKEAGYVKKNANVRHLVRKLRSDTADQFVVRTTTMVEQRRVLWTTMRNLSLWFDTWELSLLQLGFGQLKSSAEQDKNIVGSIIFYDGQMRRIGNFDETAAALDNTTGNRGGRPPTVFHAPCIPGGSTMANKSGYSATIICGSNAAGEPFPPHFQLKSNASAERQKLDVDHIQNSRNIVGQFGHREVRSHPCTFGMNEKAGMNEEELEKYIFKAILPLFPDAADEERKRVLLKVDSGPGRTNIGMLTRLRLHGFYLSPGVPNTTHVTQETDQNYGPFKSGFRKNLGDLSDYRLQRRQVLKISDLPLLVFGGVVNDELSMIPCFDRSFCHESNRKAWESVGACPLTRKCLSSTKVRHEVVQDDDGTYNLDADPMSSLFLQLETHNTLCCDLLTSVGFDGNQLRAKAPVIKAASEPAVTVPHTRERQEAILAAKTAGDLFFATGGTAINSDDFFISKAIGEHAKKVAEMTTAKTKRTNLLLLEVNAREAMEAHNVQQNGISRLTLTQMKPLLLWKLQGKAIKGTKTQQIEQWNELPEPPAALPWTEDDESTLQSLKTKEISMNDTTLVDERKRMVTAVAAQIKYCSPATIQTLEEKIREEIINKLNVSNQN